MLVLYTNLRTDKRASITQRRRYTLYTHRICDSEYTRIARVRARAQAQARLCTTQTQTTQRSEREGSGIIRHYTRTFVHRIISSIYTNHYGIIVLCIVLPSTYLHTAHRVESIAELNKIVLYPKDLIINFSIVSNIARDSVQYTLNQ